MRKGLRAIDDWPQAGQRNRKERHNTVEMDLRSAFTLQAVLLIAQRFNRILARGPERRVKSADAAAHNSHQKRDQNPSWLDVDNQSCGAHHAQPGGES